MTTALIIPVYNVEKYIGECLESIAGQTLPFDEIILVDDGSTDASYQICRRFADCHPTVTLLRQENQGQGKARNVGLDMAESEYIMFCDADDYLDLCANEAVHRAAEQWHEEAVFFDASCVYEPGFGGGKNPYDRSWFLEAGTMTGEEYFVREYPKMHTVSPWMMLLKKEFLDKNGIRFPEGVYYEDNVFFMEVLLKINRIQYLPEKLYRRRYRQGSTMTGAYTEKKRRDRAETIGQLQKLLLKGMREKSREAAEQDKLIRMYQSYYWNLDLEFLAEDLLKNETESTRYWRGRMLEKYRENAEKIAQAAGKKYAEEETLSILGAECLILKLLRQLGENVEEREYQEMRARYRRRVRALYAKLPFEDESAVVGIYGTGNHTDLFLESYERIAGRIKSQVLYLETDAGEGKRYRNQQVYSLHEKAQELGTVIISSFLYREKMARALKEAAPWAEALGLYEEDEAREIVWELL